jgi:hypothetical protein
MSILIVCYLRPGDLHAILENFIGSSRRIYIFIDNASAEYKEKNLEVLRIAEDFQSKLHITILHSTTNLGVGRAVPTAINWISSHETSFIILEDDCHITPPGLDFLERSSSLLLGEVTLISATSPWDLPEGKHKNKVVTTSSYPLISGWATSTENWKEISFLIGMKPPYLKSLLFLLRKPGKLLPVCFFLAAHIKVYKGELKAWDCSLALAMLLKSKIALIPNITTVTNTGRDDVASHTVPSIGEDTIFRKASGVEVSEVVAFGFQDRKDTDRQIEDELYGLGPRNMLSPLKALLTKLDH